MIKDIFLLQMNKPLKAKPFIKWVGGKGQLISTFETMLPPHFEQIDDVTYIEPFIGGGAMLFFMLKTFPNIKRAIINDLNPDLIRAYNTIKNSPEELIQSLNKIQKEYLLIDKESERKLFYLDIRNTYNGGNLSNVENTTYLIFLNKTCFNGLYRVNSKGGFNVPFGKYKNPKIYDEEELYDTSILLQNVEAICGDFELTEQYVTENTFVYFDPPYRPLDATSSFNSYAKEVFNDKEQVRLKDFFDKLSNRNCLLMLSNSDCRGRNENDTFFDDLYADYNISRVLASRSINSNPKKRGKLSELLIRNY